MTLSVIKLEICSGSTSLEKPHHALFLWDTPRSWYPSGVPSRSEMGYLLHQDGSVLPISPRRLFFIHAIFFAQV